MPKPYTFPTLLDEAKQVSITKLKEFGYMESDSFKSGRLIWSSRGEEIGSINIFVDMQESSYAELSYTYNKEEQVRYKVNMDSVESNLGMGRIWYFICPHTASGAENSTAPVNTFCIEMLILMLCMSARLTLKEAEWLIRSVRS